MSEKTYKTTNFHIAVWLMMNNINLISVDWIGKNRAEFVFEEFENSDDIVQSFFKQDQLQKYISNSQTLKARMYAFRSPNDYERPNKDNS